MIRETPMNNRLHDQPMLIMDAATFAF